MNYILSEDKNYNNSNKNTHINENIINSHFPIINENSINEYAVCICGPPSFNKLCEK